VYRDVPHSVARCMTFCLSTADALSLPSRSVKRFSRRYRAFLRNDRCDFFGRGRDGIEAGQIGLDIVRNGERFLVFGSLRGTCSSDAFFFAFRPSRKRSRLWKGRGSLERACDSAIRYPSGGKIPRQPKGRDERYVFGDRGAVIKPR